MRVQQVTISITYDEKYYDEPSSWNWAGNIFCGEVEDVTLIEFGPVYKLRTMLYEQFMEERECGSCGELYVTLEWDEDHLCQKCWADYHWRHRGENKD